MHKYGDEYDNLIPPVLFQFSLARQRELELGSQWLQHQVSRVQPFPFLLPYHLATALKTNIFPKKIKHSDFHLERTKKNLVFWFMPIRLLLHF